MNSTSELSTQRTTQLTDGCIRRMPDVLTWTDDSQVLEHIHDSYVALVSDRLAAYVGRLWSTNHSVAITLTDAISSLPTPSLMRLLLAPETTFRLLGGPNRAPDDWAAFLLDAAVAEAAFAGHEVRKGIEAWTAVGDALLSADGQLIRGPAIEGLMPLDFDSPFSSDIDLTGDEYRVSQRRSRMPDADVLDVIERLQELRNALSRMSTTLLPFVAQFTKVLILQSDDTRTFSSGSNGHFIGRSVIANPLAASSLDLAEGVVHEAIHALLYMQEEQQPWVLSAALYEPRPAIESPWTQRQLPLRPFLQACFVWYGLTNFWGQCCAQGIYDDSRAVWLFKRAAAGFLRGPLVKHLAPFRSSLSDDIVWTISELQRRVVAGIG